MLVVVAPLRCRRGQSTRYPIRVKLFDAIRWIASPTDAVQAATWALGDHERDHTASVRNAPSRRLAIENAITSAAAPRQGLALPLARGYGRDELRTVNDSWGDASCFDLRS